MKTKIISKPWVCQTTWWAIAHPLPTLGSEEENILSFLQANVNSFSK
jgi:hypothetical protein